MTINLYYCRFRISVLFVLSSQENQLKRILQKNKCSVRFLQANLLKNKKHSDGTAAKEETYCAILYKSKFWNKAWIKREIMTDWWIGDKCDKRVQLQNRKMLLFQIWRRFFCHQIQLFVKQEIVKHFKTLLKLNVHH